MFTGEIQRSRSKTPLVVGLFFVVLVVGIVLLVPMPRTLKSTFVLAAVSTVELTAPRDGTIAEVTSTTGATVARGSIIAKYDVSEAEKKVPGLEVQIDALKKQKDSGSKPNPKAKAAVAKAEGALKAATAALGKATRAARGKKTPALAAAEKKQKAATAALEQAQSEVGQSPEEVEKQLTTAQDALAAAKVQLSSGNIIAPASGVLTVTGLEKGRAVVTGAKLAMVEETSRLKALVKVPAGETIKKGQAVELLLPKGKKRVLFDLDAKGDVAEAAFDNAKGDLTVGVAGAANIEGTQRSLVGR